MRIAAATALAVLVIATVDTDAQTAVGVVAGASKQDAGASDLPYLGPPFGGTTAGLIGMVDFRMSRRSTVGGEASLSGAISGDQSQRSSSATNAFTSRHRDSVFSGVYKLGTPLDSRIHAAAAVGGGLAYRRTAREGTTAPLFPPSTRSPYADAITDFVLAFSFGGDVDVRVTDRVRILGVARWHRLRDDDRDSNGVVKRGVSSSIFRAGAGVKLEF